MLPRAFERKPVTENTLRTDSRRRLSPADKAMVVVMIAIVLIGVGRLGVLVIDLGLNKGATSGTARQALTTDQRFLAWWGVGRPLPKAKGGDYLAWLRERTTKRTLGPVLGTVIERQKAQGVEISEVFVPEDNHALLGDRAGASFTRADGTVITTSWSPIGVSGANLTGTPLTERSYEPVLTDDEFAMIESGIGLTTVTRDFRVGGSAEGGSGSWIIYGHDMPNGQREYLLIPLEASPEGGAL